MPNYEATRNVYDSLNRTVRIGLGTADQGGAYTAAPSTRFSVTPGVAHISVPTAASVRATLPVQTTDEQMQTVFSVPRPSAGGGVYAGLELRRQANGDAYRVRVRLTSTNRILLSFTQVRNGTETHVGTEITLPQQMVTGRQIVLQGMAAGSTSVRLEARAWLVGASVPDWQLTHIDSSSTRLTRSGNVGLWLYTSSGSPMAKFSVVNVTGWSLKQVGTTSAPSSSSPVTIATPSGSASTSSAPASKTPTSSAAATSAAADTSEAASQSAGSEPTGSATPTQTMSTTSLSSTAQPGPDNTGVPLGTHLTQHYGDLTITTAGATYDSLDIHGFVYVKAPNVTIKRSIIRGGVASGNIGLVNDVSDTATNFVIEDSELVPEHPSVWIDAVKGWNYTALRINAHGTVDTAKVYGDNVTIEHSWLHDTQYYDSDPNQGGGHTHNDGVQVLSGQNIRIIGNTITDAYNSALQVTQDHGAVSDLRFNDNWADGGGCTVNLASKPLPTMSGITVDYNRFGHDTRVADCAIISGPETSLTAVGNVWDDTSQPVTVRQGT